MRVSSLSPNVQVTPGSTGRGRRLPLAAVSAAVAIAVWLPAAWARPPQDQDEANDDSAAEPAEGSARSRAADSVEELIERVRSQASTRGDALRASPSLVDELYEFLDAHPKDPRSGELRHLAAQLLMLSGDSKDAKNAVDLWAEMVRSGPTDDDRARGLYALGEHYLVRSEQSRARTKRLRGFSSRYFELLAERYPDSSWARYAQRPLALLRLAASGKAPEFRATFDDVSGPVEHSLPGTLSGKVAMIIFWRTTCPGHRENEAAIYHHYAKFMQQHPAVAPFVEVLGVSLEEQRGVFEQAVSLWRLQWPQYFDGKAFESPLVKTFAVPRLAYFAVIDPDAKLAYLGASSGLALNAFLAELRKKGEALEAGEDSKDSPAPESESAPLSPQGDEPESKEGSGKESPPAESPGESTGGSSEESSEEDSAGDSGSESRE